MVIEFHTPKGIIPVDSDTITDAELAELNVTRGAFDELMSHQRDFGSEIDQNKEDIKRLKEKI